MASASSQRFSFGPSARGLFVVLLAVAAVGCKSGSPWTAKPSWWTFGGSGEDPAKLAAAPPAPTDVTKPSATAKPYPTTTTPEGYVLENAQREGQTQVASSASRAPTTPAAEPAAITYGSKPAAVAATPAPPPQMTAASAGGGGNLSGIAPQIGPYGAPPGSAPLEQTLPSSVPGSSVAAAPAEAAGVRMADARVADSWAAAPAAAPPMSGDSRYATSPGSRFAGASVSPMPQTAPITTSAPVTASAPITASAPAFPAITPAAPAAVAPPGSADPLAAPAVGPTAAPSSLAPPTPTRRADPGYRPGGTSSYRPSRTILAGDDGAEPAAIQPVSFEMPMNQSP